MRMRFHRSLLVSGITIAAVALALSQGSAQEKYKISFKSDPTSTKFTQQHAIEVGDIPGHQVRLAENRATYPDNPPMIDGIKVVESWNRYTTDYTDLNGQLLGYSVWVLANGDKVFTRIVGTSQSVVKDDGSRRTTTSAVSTITGGTGRFRNARGILRTSAVFDPKAGYISAETEGDYWFE